MPQGFLDDLKTLGDAEPLPLLQVLIRSFRVERSVSGLNLHFEIHEDLPVIQSRAEREAVQAQLDFEEGKRTLAAIVELARSAPGQQIDFELENFAFRHASAGVLPLIGTELRPLLFLRDIHPVGWNIANGGSSNRSELIKIEDLMLREAREEILFHDRKRGLIRGLEGAETNEEANQAMRLWRTRLSCGLGTALDHRFRAGPDSIVIRDSYLTRQTRAVKLGFDVPGFGFEVMRFLEIDDQARLNPLDGEINQGRLLDRPVGLFNDLAALRRGLPDELFQGGRRHLGASIPAAALCPATAALCGIRA